MPNKDLKYQLENFKNVIIHLILNFFVHVQFGNVSTYKV